MSIFRRRLMINLEEPLYEKEVEYLLTDGNQYFTLPIYPNEATDAVEITFRATTATNLMRFCYASGSAFHLYVNTAARAAYSVDNSWYGLSSSNNSKVDTVKHTYKIDYFNKKVTFDFFDVTFTKTSTRVGTSGLRIARAFTTGGNTYYFEGLIYSVKFWRSGVLLYDFIPVRKRSVGYFFDKVNRELYANEGTGNWILGYDKFNDISCYTVLDYIRTIGTSSTASSLPYIDTGISSKAGIIQMTLVAKWNTVSSSRKLLFGVSTGPWFGCNANKYTSTGDVLYPDISQPSTSAYTTFTMDAYTPPSNIAAASIGPIALFRAYYVSDRSGVSNYSYIASCNLKRFKITVDGVLVRDFVPVIHPTSNVYGMFDLIEKKFYDSANGIAFLGGFDT